MENKCFALIEGTKCNALTVEKCPGTCSFFKTTEQHNESCEMANARLASLSQGQQMDIAMKYYQGQMPWLAGR